MLPTYWFFVEWKEDGREKERKDLTQSSPDGSAGEEAACRAGDLGLIPGSGRSPGEGNGCLENFRDTLIIPRAPSLDLPPQGWAPAGSFSSLGNSDSLQPLIHTITVSASPTEKSPTKGSSYSGPYFLNFNSPPVVSLSPNSKSDKCFCTQRKEQWCFILLLLLRRFSRVRLCATP